MLTVCYTLLILCQGVSSYFPGTDVIGAGYDIIHGNPEGGDASSGNLDPGIKVTKHIFQITTRVDGSYKELSISNRSFCSSSTRSNLVYSAASYRNDLFAEIDYTPLSSNTLKPLAFSESILYKDITTATSSGDIVYIDKETECQKGIITYDDDMVKIDNYALTRHFAGSVCALPVTYDAGKYLTFLDRWGTHVIMEVHIGYKEINHYQTTKLDLFRDIMKTDHQLLNASGPYMNSATSLVLNIGDFRGSSVADRVLGSLHRNVKIGSDNNSQPIRIKVVPITEAMKDKYWMASDNYGDISICDNIVAALKTKSANMYRAYTEYGKKYQGNTPAVTDMRIPLQWPVGCYGLPEAKSGCPAGGVSWLEGWISQDNEDSNNANRKSDNAERYLKVKQDSYGTESHFCIKEDNTSPTYGMNWPKGSYCILRKDSDCQAGFQKGTIHWDDEDSGNGNRHSGALPSGQFGAAGATIDFCCRSDTPVSTAILLPTEKSFVLYRYGSSCQQVLGMRSDEVKICQDTEDHDNADSFTGKYPSLEGSANGYCHGGITLNYCHYSSLSQAVYPVG
ncbi:uncharacterized protein LOC128558289 [Mercenaria mercenaria]|uniref:uncharacterized protein LOC128558289 n=1 Tax=Mercenaria mercenaria TaxID=6596 RepID=UPI00234E3C97|nr:uncharacterized protein LOC128558289 [Mercenaria mercenaria]